MTNKNLTDNDIKKALEGMIQFADTVDRSVLDMVDVQTLKNALDYINRLEADKAENERLKEKLDTVKAILYKTLPLIEEDIKTAKAEAYKEFAERLKEVSQHEIYCDNTLPKPIITYHIIEDKINNLLKELVGDTNVCFK